MRRSAAGLAVAGALLAASAGAQTTPLAAVADTYLRQGAANQNQGQQTILEVQQSGNHRTLVRMDQAAIAAAVGGGSLASATLELYVTSSGNWGSSGRTVDLHRLTAAWTENGATWNCADDSNPANGQANCAAQWAGGSFEAEASDSVLHTNGTSGRVQFNVTADVRAFLAGTSNFGWLAKLADETAGGNADYVSRQGASDKAPRLVLVVESAGFDQVPPSLSITAPSSSVLINDPTPEIVVAYADGGSGVDLSSLVVQVDGAAAACTPGSASAVCEPAALVEGSHTITATLRDQAGNPATASLAFALLIGPGRRSASFAAVGDTSLRLGEPNRNYGGETFLRVRQSGKNRALVRFDAAEIARIVGQGTLSAARLELTMTKNGRNWGRNGRTVDAHRLTADWAEAGATWNCAIDTQPANSQANCATQWAGGTFQAAPVGSVLHTNDLAGTVSFDVTADVAALLAGTPAYGWLLKKTAEGESGLVEYASREAGAAPAPLLVVFFDVPANGDTTPPAIAITAPSASPVYNDPTPAIRVEYSDAGSGVDTATLVVRVDGVAVSGCQAGATTASCTSPPLTTGSRSIRAEIRDRAGIPGVAVRNFDLILDAAGPSLELFVPSGSTGTEGDAPEVSAAFGDPGSGIEPGSFRLTLDGVAVTGCTLAELSARCPLPALAAGDRRVAAEVRDRAGNISHATFDLAIAADSQAPALAITAPAAGQIHGATLPEIVLTYSDERSGVASATLAVTVDGGEVTASCQVSAAGAVCPPRSLAAGAHRIDAAVADGRGNRATAHREVELSTRLEIAIDSPLNGRVTRDAATTVTGTVAPEATGVRVGEVEASLSGGRFVAADVPLREGSNALTATARSSAGGAGTATVTVVRDTEAPRVIVNSPRDGSVAASSEIVVAGEVADLTSSSQDLPQLAVTVDGRPAVVEQRSFLLPGYLLHPGENVIRVDAEDAAGNVGHAEVRVTFAINDVARLEPLSGNLQTARAGEPLAEPLAVRVTDFLGRPLAGRTVDFAVTRGDGAVISGLETARKLTVVTDDSGISQVDYSLGRRSGEGNHEVTVTSLGIPGAVVFCASARPGPPAMLLPINGNEFQGARFGAAGRPYPKPLFSQVFDAFANPVPGIEVTYRAVAGGGSFDGGQEAVVTTDREGRARAIFTLGPDEGVNNNVATASLAGVEGLPATFIVSGLVPGPTEATALSGVLLDPSDTPVPGAGIHVGSLATTTDADGRFHLAGVPVGTIHLAIDGSTVTRPGVWPPLAFELVTVAGRDNTLGKPLRLPQLDDEGKRRVGGDEDVVLPIRGVAGATLTVRAHSATFPDGSHEGFVSFTQVPSFKVPMVAPMNTNFQLAWSIQPPGVRFDPPAKVTIPNFGAPASGGNPPGMTTEIFAFDHDLEEFVSAGTAAISDDGQRMESLPGFGIVKSGWGGCPRPPAPPAAACQPGSCTKCEPGPVPKFDRPDLTALADGEETAVVVAVDAPVRFTVTSLPAGAAALKAESCNAAAPEWSFGDGATGGGNGVSHPYKEPGEYAAKVTVKCGECRSSDGSDQVKVVAVKLRIAEAELSGDGFHAVRKDGNRASDGTYDAPHWQDNSSPLDGDAADAGDRRFPVSYVKGSTIEMSLKVEAGADLPGDAAAKTKVRGHGPQGIEFPATASTFEGQRIVASGLRASSALPATIELLDPFEVSWEVSFDDGQTWSDLGKTDNRVYVTLADPIEDTNLFESLVDIGCRNARGSAAADDAFARIWSAFASRNVRRKAIDGFNQPDGQTMRYWFERGDPRNDPGGPVFNECKLLSQMLSPEPGDPGLNGVGTCGAWASLLHKTALALGIPGSQVLKVVPDQSVHPEAQMFMVKTWTFGKHIQPGAPNACESQQAGDDVPSAPGGRLCLTPGRNGILDSPVAPTDVEADGVAAALFPRFPYLLFDPADREGSPFGDVADQLGAPAQQTMDPPAIFVNHFVVGRNGQIYDPSYGAGPFANELEWEKASVAGIMTLVEQPSRLVLARKKDPSRRELVFTDVTLADLTVGEE